MHRDIKPANVFLTEKNGQKKCLLGDMGVGKMLGSTTDFSKTAIGTLYFISPEMYRNEKYNQQTDIWSLGALLY